MLGSLFLVTLGLLRGLVTEGDAMVAAVAHSSLDAVAKPIITCKERIEAYNQLGELFMSSSA